MAARGCILNSGRHAEGSNSRPDSAEQCVRGKGPRRFRSPRRVLGLNAAPATLVSSVPIALLHP